MPSCKSCGTIAADQGAQFCTQCGRALQNDPPEGDGAVHEIDQTGTEAEPKKRGRPYGCLAVVVGLVIVFVAAALCSQSETNDPLPTYTPSPAEIDAAYATAISRMDRALESLDKISVAAIQELDAAPEVLRNAVDEARNCNTPIESLTRDPRETRAAHFAGSSRLREEVLEAPPTTAGDIAAARVASSANRDLIDSAANSLTADDPDLDPVIKAYWAYYRTDTAKNKYMADLSEINDAYMPVADNILQPAFDDLISAFLAAPDTAGCVEYLSTAYGNYMAAYEEHRPSFVAYFAGLKTALEAYAAALGDERERHASRR